MNRTSSSEEIAIFVRVVETGSFAAAAEELGLTPSGVSKAVTRLEDRLGVKLMQRTTRRLVLTGEGETLLARGRDILAAIEAAEAEVTMARGKPRGLLKVNTGTAYAKHKLAPLLPAFQARYPDISLDLSIADRRVDVIGEQIDVAIRTGSSGDSSLITRRIGEMRRVICASPGYLARHGTPTVPADLLRHNCLSLTGFARLAAWPMQVDGRVTEMNVKGNITCDSAELLLDMTIAGLGIARFGDFMVQEALTKGDIVPLLVDHHVAELWPISALMPPGRQHLPRVRAFVDFLAGNTGHHPLPHL
ncbi:MAG: LysR family transcriptional regulator [Bosea sp. (in: a-proteobacteria)]